MTHLQDYVDASAGSGYRPVDPALQARSNNHASHEFATARSATMRGVVAIRGSVDVECQCAAWFPGRVLVGLMFFSLELSLSRMASKSNSRSWLVTGAHIQGRLKGKIKHLMSEMNLQLQQLCFFSYHLTCIKSPRSLNIFLASLHASPRAHRSCLSVSS